MSLYKKIEKLKDNAFLQLISVALGIFLIIIIGLSTANYVYSRDAMMYNKLFNPKVKITKWDAMWIDFRRGRH